MHLRPIWWPAVVVLLAVADAQTPVIGGLCKLGSSDVQIGGKQTQFFLKCEERQGADEKAYGVWVVKSRASAVEEPETSHPKSIPTTRRRTQATCQQDHEARAGLPCNFGGECLQFNYDDATTYLQCDADSRWIKRICGNNLVFSFHHQACIGDGTNSVPGRVPVPAAAEPQPSFRAPQQSRDLSPSEPWLVCTFHECSAIKPCPSKSAECRNGYCCEPVPTSPAPVAAAAPLSNIRTCPDNSMSLDLACVSDSHCPPGYCCPGGVGACCKINDGIPQPVNTVDNPSAFALPPMSSFPVNRRFQSVVTTGSSSCYSGCPRGFSGCCGTQQTSCCLQQNACPSGQTPTGRSCYTSCPSGQTCNGGVCCTAPQPAACPSNAQAVGQCINGRCGTGYSCQTSSNICCPGSGQQFICPDGTQAAGACIGGLCGAGFSCNNGLCCRGSSSTTLRCLDGTTPLGTCLNGLCPLNYQCSIGNICCGSGGGGVCTNGQPPIGPCVNGLCPQGFTCNTANNQCCASPPTCTNPIGPCIGVTNDCPIGFSCDITSNQCCQGTGTGTTPAPGACPVGSTLLGPTQGGLCPPGANVVGNNCCLPTRTHRAQVSSALIGGRIQKPALIGNCPDGQQGIGQCIGGQCGNGFLCINNLCCSATAHPNLCPNGEQGVSACFQGGVCGTGFVCDARTNLCCASMNSHMDEVKPIALDSTAVGGVCKTPEQCAGYSDGLATCVDGKCTCQPVAYSQGVACVRRKLLRFNDDREGALPEDNERIEESKKTSA